jgi:hypothetical protein
MEEDDGDNLYNADDDDFESYESPSCSNKSKQKPNIFTDKEAEKQKNDESPSKKEKEEDKEKKGGTASTDEFDGQDLDLETFMSRHNKGCGNDESSSEQVSMGSSGIGAENIAPSDPSMLRPLVGTTPNPDDHLMMKMSKRLGYSISAGREDGGGGVSNADLLQAANSKIGAKEKKKLRIKTPSDGARNDDDANDDDDDDELAETASSLLKRTNAIRNGQLQYQRQKDDEDGTIRSDETTDDPVRKLRNSLLPPHKRDDTLMDVAEIEKENARKVDQLLNSLNLLPAGKYLNSSGVAKQASGKMSRAPLSKASLSHPKSNRMAGQVYGVGAVPTEELSDPKRQQSSLEHTIASLKKDLRMRDDRLQRLTEHSMLLGNNCDDLKIQVDDLTQRLSKAEAELEAKEVRVENAMKAKKKFVKKCHQLEEELRGFTVVQSEYERLKDRENALIEAVQELSAQNEDLIEKLKESMRREMDFAQSRVDKIARIGGGGGARNKEERDRFDVNGSNSDTSPPRAGGGERGNRAHSDSSANRPIGGKKKKKGANSQLHFPELK